MLISVESVSTLAFQILLFNHPVLEPRRLAPEDFSYSGKRYVGSNSVYSRQGSQLSHCHNRRKQQNPLTVTACQQIEGDGSSTNFERDGFWFDLRVYCCRIDVVSALLPFTQREPRGQQDIKISSLVRTYCTWRECSQSLCFLRIIVVQ